MFTAVLKKKVTAPANTTEPKKVEKKIDLDFSQFFLHFWPWLLNVVLMNTMFIVWK
jgi:hypothetical protein